MTRRKPSQPEIDLSAEEKNAWAKFTTAELETKLLDLRKLVGRDMLTDRSLDNQFAEIALIEQELERRGGR